MIFGVFLPRCWQGVSDRQGCISLIRKLHDTVIAQASHALCCQVARLQDTAAPSGVLNSVCASTPTPKNDAGLDSIQQWIKQQADAIATAIQMPVAPDTSAHQLPHFLPAFMTQHAAQQEANPIDAAPASTLSSAEPDHSDAVPAITQGVDGAADANAQQHLQQQGGSAVPSQSKPQSPAGDEGVMADRQDPKPGNSATGKSQVPTTWLEWERQLQVVFVATMGMMLCTASDVATLVLLLHACWQICVTAQSACLMCP